MTKREYLTVSILRRAAKQDPRQLGSEGWNWCRSRQA